MYARLRKARSPLLLLRSKGLLSGCYYLNRKSRDLQHNIVDGLCLIFVSALTRLCLNWSYSVGLGRSSPMVGLCWIWKFWTWSFSVLLGCSLSLLVFAALRLGCSRLSDLCVAASRLNFDALVCRSQSVLVALLRLCCACLVHCILFVIVLVAVLITLDVKSGKTHFKLSQMKPKTVHSRIVKSNQTKPKIVESSQLKSRQGLAIQVNSNQDTES